MSIETNRNTAFPSTMQPFPATYTPFHPAQNAYFSEDAYPHTSSSYLQPPMHTNKGPFMPPSSLSASTTGYTSSPYVHPSNMGYTSSPYAGLAATRSARYMLPPPSPRVPETHIFMTLTPFLFIAETILKAFLPPMLHTITRRCHPRIAAHVVEEIFEIKTPRGHTCSNECCCIRPVSVQ